MVDIYPLISSCKTTMYVVPLCLRGLIVRKRRCSLVFHQSEVTMMLAQHMRNSTRVLIG